MRRTLAFAALIALAPLGLAPIAEAHPTAPARRNVAVRQVHQQQRIAQGVRAGTLTRGETVALRRGQAHVAHLKRHALRDGRLSAGERARLERAQDKQGARTWRLKHNGRNRGA